MQQQTLLFHHCECTLRPLIPWAIACQDIQSDIADRYFVLYSIYRFPSTVDFRHEGSVSDMKGQVYFLGIGSRLFLMILLTDVKYNPR